MGDANAAEGADAMSAHLPVLWSTLNSEDGTSIVVPEGADPTEALLELLHTEYGGVFTIDNPVVQRAAEGLKVECWHSCTKKYIEAEVLDDYGQGGDWWSPDGDGKRSIHVVYYDGSVWSLGEEAETAQEAMA